MSDREVRRVEVRNEVRAEPISRLDEGHLFWLVLTTTKKCWKHSVLGGITVREPESTRATPDNGVYAPQSFTEWCEEGTASALHHRIAMERIRNFNG